MSNNQGRITMFAYYPKDGSNPITIDVPSEGEEEDWNNYEEEEYFEEEQTNIEQEAEGNENQAPDNTQRQKEDEKGNN